NGGLAANRLAASADVVLAVGTRLTDFTTASRAAFQHPEVRFIHLNVAASDAFKLGALPLIGDAREGLRALTDGLSEVGYRTDTAFTAEVQALRHEWAEAVDAQLRVDNPEKLTQANVIGMVNAASRPQDVVVCAAGGMPGDLLKLWRTRDPKGYHLEYGYSCMGYEIAGGLGVKMADPDREVYVLVGDGSYLMLNHEIVTSLQEGYKLIIVLVDNGGFQCIRSLQMSAGSPSFGNELRYRNRESGRLDGPFIPIDYVQNAESLGAKAYRAATAAELEDALAKAKDADRTVLIHVPVDPEARVPSYESWWDVPVAEVSEQPGVQEALAAYRAAKAKQRFYY
ncbi:MAG TPA: thiamine pyrophosphate-dependent enzyme, partial [Limnochordia bacterium]